MLLPSDAWRAMWAEHAQGLTYQAALEQALTQHKETE